LNFCETHFFCKENEKGLYRANLNAKPLKSEAFIPISLFDVLQNFNSRVAELFEQELFYVIVYIRNYDNHLYISQLLFNRV